ncbi:MAG: hypothetical protein JOS17DRAFT_406198 [Linnemannia elongata]|nr:MAG: hypothetical protein JOS17DRAFT_406198 [Linnemannia elongata]
MSVLGVSLPGAIESPPCPLTLLYSPRTLLACLFFFFSCYLLYKYSTEGSHFLPFFDNPLFLLLLLSPLFLSLSISRYSSSPSSSFCLLAFPSSSSPLHSFALFAYWLFLFLILLSFSICIQPTPTCTLTLSPLTHTLTHPFTHTALNTHTHSQSHFLFNNNNDFLPRQQYGYRYHPPLLPESPLPY